MPLRRCGVQSLRALAIVLAMTAQMLQMSAATLAAARSSAAPRATPPCNSSWNVVSNPATDSLSTNGMGGLSSNDIWAVGTTNTVYSEQTMAEHWDGSNWTVKATPNVGVQHNDLRGVSAAPGDPHNVYAVGSYLDPNTIAARTLIEHWDGTSWSVVPSPNAGSGGNALASIVVLAADNAWAVGSFDGASGQAALIEHFDGVSWTIFPNPSATNAQGGLVSVSATSATDVWAAGNAFFEHWDGTTWAVVPGPPSSATVQTFINSVVAVSPSSAWAVGDMFSYSGYHTRALVEHWNGTSWSMVPSPDADVTKDNELWSVSGGSDGNIWAVGQVIADRAFTEHWNGSSWSIVTIPASDVFALTSVVSTPGNVWAGGYTGTGLVTLNFCVPFPTVDGLAPMSGNPSGGTKVIINGSGFTLATDVKFGSTSALNFTIDSDTQITAVAPSGAVGSVDVTVISWAGSSVTNPGGTFQYVPAAISWKQYALAGSDGASWKDIDAADLTLTLAPGTNSNVIVSGNADLWTATAGVNQDLGIFISGGEYGAGQLYAWKESGGYAGTFSPNAASFRRSSL